MQTPESVTLSTTIREADALLTVDAVVVEEDTDLRKVAEAAAQQTGARIISVVDSDGRLVGVIPVRSLIESIFLKIVPEQFLGEITDYQKILSYAQRLRDRTAHDLMDAAVSVHLDDTVRAAFELMHRAGLNGLPIVDDENRVVGYVDQLELLLVWLRASHREPLLEPDPGERA